jgi:replicative DNA helicase
MKGERLRENVGIIRTRAEAYANVCTLADGIDKLKSAEDDAARRNVIGDVISNLNRQTSDAIQNATAAAVAARFEEMMNAEPDPLLSTGLGWLDNNTGGFQRRQIWWIAAAYKKRKSTLLRNMAIGGLRKGASMTIAAREGTQGLLAAQLVSMLAVEWLVKKGLYSQNDARGIPLNQISAAQLMRLKKRYRTVLHRHQVEAVDAGLAEFRQWGDRLRIYDPSQKNGGLSNFSSFQMVIYRDLQKYGIDIAFADYFQLFGAGRKTLYEDTAFMARQSQQMAADHDFALVMLAQLNEESVKGNNSGHSPGVKGGGDPAATADLLLTTDYPQDASGDPMYDQLRVKIKLARHGEAGKFHDFPIHPASGLILPTVPVAELDLGAARPGGDA